MEENLKMHKINDYFSIDDTTNPGIVYTKFQKKEPTKIQFDEYLKWADKVLLELPYKYAFIMDLSEIKYTTHEQKIEIGDFIKKHAIRVRKNCVGFIYVTKSSIIAPIIMKGIFLITKPPVYYEFIKQPEDAIKKALFLLKEATENKSA